MRSPTLRTFSLVLIGATVLALVAVSPASARTPRIKKPGAPTGVSAVPISGGAVVSWSAPSTDGGSPITGYSATASHGGESCSTTGALTCTVTGLINSRHYEIRVRAGNIVGFGRAAKVRVTPSACGLPGPNADLGGCNLTGVDLSGVDLSNANLADATLTNANLTNTNLSGALLQGVVSGGIVGVPSSLPSPWSLVDGYLIGPSADLRNADLSGATLTNADLSVANFGKADLTNADLSGANLSYASFYETTLTDANLSGADMFRAYLDLATAEGANFTDAYLVAASMEAADFQEAILTGANLSYADLSAAHLDGADLTGVVWYVTTCPDASNSGGDGGTCVNDL